MEITLNITEDSKVELIKDSCEAVQSEKNVTILNINFPSILRGYSIDNYAKQIEFGECKELGECVKFFDRVEGNTYKLCDICTQFKKVMIQFTLTNLVDEAEPIVWKTIPFALEFYESINAENTKQAQVTLLSLAEIEREWENYIKDNTFRVVSRVGDVPTANAASLGSTIFYLGANSTSPYVLTYGHYYKCNYVNNVYEWTDLTQDPSLEGVANGIREINHNQTMQKWVGTKEELANEVIQENVEYIPIDLDIKETFDEVLTEMAEDENYNLAYPLIKDKNGVLRFGNIVIPQKKVLWNSDNGLVVSSGGAYIDLSEAVNSGDVIEVVSRNADSSTRAPIIQRFKMNGTGDSSTMFVSRSPIRLNSGAITYEYWTVRIYNNDNGSTRANLSRGMYPIPDDSSLDNNYFDVEYFEISKIIE